jgi:hypothetical protein
VGGQIVAGFAATRQPAQEDRGLDLEHLARDASGIHSYEPDSYEIVQPWWAWSGMRIEETDDGVLLRCSGNYDGPNFADLAVRIRFVEADN